MVRVDLDGCRVLGPRKPPCPQRPRGEAVRVCSSRFQSRARPQAFTRSCEGALKRARQRTLIRPRSCPIGRTLAVAPGAPRVWLDEVSDRAAQPLALAAAATECEVPAPPGPSARSLCTLSVPKRRRGVVRGPSTLLRCRGERKPGHRPRSGLGQPLQNSVLQVRIAVTRPGGDLGTYRRRLLEWCSKPLVRLRTWKGCPPRCKLGQ